MSAKEMFEELGFKLISYGDKELINYRKYQQDNVFEQVVFNNNQKNFWCGVTIVKDFDTLISCANSFIVSPREFLNSFICSIF